MTDATIRQDDEMTPLDDLVGYHLRRATGVFNQDFGRALAGTEMRQVPFGVLSVVQANPGIRQGAAGELLDIQRANMVVLVNELVDRGLIARRVADDDRRAFALTVTPAGREMLATCLVRIHAHEDRLLADLDNDERTTLIGLLRRIERRAPCAR